MDPLPPLIRIGSDIEFMQPPLLSLLSDYSPSQSRRHIFVFPLRYVHSRPRPSVHVWLPGFFHTWLITNSTAAVSKMLQRIEEKEENRQIAGSLHFSFDSYMKV